MIYRYRLKHCKENEGFNSRQFEGVTLYRKRWLYSDKPLLLNSFLNFIEFQSAETEEELEKKFGSASDQRVIPLRKKVIENKLMIEDKNIVEDTIDIKNNPNISEKVVLDDTELTIKNIPEVKEKKIEETNTTKINTLIYEELYQEALKRGFIEKELEGVSKKYLFELLILEESIL